MILSTINQDISSMEKVNKTGKIMQNMKVIGEMAWLKVKAHFITLMVTFNQVNIIRIKQMAMVNTFILMGRDM